MPQYVTLGTPTLTNGVTCTYSIGCNQDYLDLMYNGSQASGNTITCTGTGCDNLQSQINNYSCQLHCPETARIAIEEGSNLTISKPTYTEGVCKYNVYCKGDLTLYHDGTQCTMGTNNNVTCNDYNDCYGPLLDTRPSYVNLHNRIMEFSCEESTTPPDGGKGPGDLVEIFTTDENLTEKP